MIYQDKFAVGDRVTWRDEKRASDLQKQIRHGDGPFTIIGVIDVPPGGQEGAGHTQSVKIKELVLWHSGAWFRKV